MPGESTEQNRQHVIESIAEALERHKVMPGSAFFQADAEIHRAIFYLREGKPQPARQQLESWLDGLRSGVNLYQIRAGEDNHVQKLLEDLNSLFPEK